MKFEERERKCWITKSHFSQRTRRRLKKNLMILQAGSRLQVWNNCNGKYSFPVAYLLFCFICHEEAQWNLLEIQNQSATGNINSSGWQGGIGGGVIFKVPQSANSSLSSPRWQQVTLESSIGRTRQVTSGLPFLLPPLFFLFTRYSHRYCAGTPQEASFLKKGKENLILFFLRLALISVHKEGFACLCL